MTLVVYTCLDIRYQPQEYRAKSGIARTAHRQGRQHSIAGVWETRRSCSEGRPQGCMGWGEAGHQTVACGNPCLVAPSRCASMIATKNRFLPASVHGLHSLHAQILSPTASLARPHGTGHRARRFAALGFLEPHCNLGVRHRHHFRGTSGCHGTHRHCIGQLRSMVEQPRENQTAGACRHPQRRVDLRLCPFLRFAQHRSFGGPRCVCTASV